MAMGDIRFDKRVILRNLSSGVITREEYQQHLEKLKDLSGDTEIFEAGLSSGKKQIPRGVVEDEDEDL